MGGRLRVISANLWNGRADPAAFAQLVERLAADVVAVQELTPDQADALARVLPHGHLEPSRDHCGMGLAARQPVRIERVPLYQRRALRCELDPGDWPELAERLDVFNVHLFAPQVVRPRPGLFVRPRQLRELARHLLDSEASACQVLVGDLNSTPGWPAYHWFARRFTDAAVAAAAPQGIRARPTWGPWHGSPRLIRIDHGFVRGLDVEGFEVVTVQGSDHDAVVLDVRVG